MEETHLLKLIDLPGERCPKGIHELLIIRERHPRGRLHGFQQPPQAMCQEDNRQGQVEKTVTQAQVSIGRLYSRQWCTSTKAHHYATILSVVEARSLDVCTVYRPR